MTRLLIAGTLAVVVIAILRSRRCPDLSAHEYGCQPCDIRTDELEGLAEWWSYYERSNA